LLQQLLPVGCCLRLQGLQLVPVARQQELSVHNLLALHTAGAQLLLLLVLLLLLLAVAPPAGRLICAHLHIQP
jgi:hypothetical protein